MDEVLTKLIKANTWITTPGGDNQGTLGYRRSLYLSKVEKHLNNSLTKVITGQRRTGKSYLLRQIISDLRKQVPPENLFYLNKELLDFDTIKTYSDLGLLLSLYKNKYKPQGKMYYFFDEVQEVDGWEKLVNSLTQNPQEPCEAFITGSNSKMLSGELATHLSGRFVQFEVFPFMFSEYCQLTSSPATKESYLKYLQLGGLPELYKLQDREVQTNYVSSLVDTILLNDIVKKYNVREPAFLGDLFKFVSDNISNMCSVNSIANAIKASKSNATHDIVSNYLSYLCQAILIHEVERYDVKGKSILLGSKKYYLNDLSYKNFLFSSFDPGLNKNLENAVFLYYRQQGYQVYVGTIKELEVDFIVEKPNDKKYVQVTYTLVDQKVIDREYASLQAIRDNYEKLVISMDDVSFGDKDGIKHLLPWEM